MSKIAVRALLAVSLCVAGVSCNSASHHPHVVAPIDERQTIEFLASDDLEGRGIGTAGLDRAADAIAADFSAIGLRPLPGMKTFFQPLPITIASEIGPKTFLRAGDRTFIPKDDFVPLSISANGEFNGPVVFAGYGIQSAEHHYDDYAGLDVKGKVVLVMRFEPHDETGKSRFDSDGWSDAASLTAKAKSAAEQGAVALLVVTPATFHEDDNRLMTLSQRIGSGRGNSPDGGSSAMRIPILQVKNTVAEELLRLGGSPDLQTLQRKIDSATPTSRNPTTTTSPTTTAATTTAKSHAIAPASAAIASVPLPGVTVAGEVQIVQKTATVKNVVGYLRGKKSNSFVVIGAHYDHLGRGGIGSLTPKSHEIHNGADDNASGTAAMLSLAARFAAGPTPERSIIFIAFTGEEEGLIGSQYFIDHSPVVLTDIVAMLNLDMVGRIRPAEAAATQPTTGATTNAAVANIATTQPAGQPSGGLLYIGGSGTAEAFEAMVRRADADSPLIVRDIGKGGLGPSDHMSFALKRIPVIFLFSGLHADYHRPTDDADKINYDGLHQIIDFTFDLVSQMLKMPKQDYVVASDAFSMKTGTTRDGPASSSGSRATLGVVPDYSSFGSEGNPSIGGVRISGTSSGSPAAAAGLKAGDVITAFDGKPIDTLMDLSDALARSKAGQKVKIKVLRGDGKNPAQPIEMEATLAERKD